MPKYDPPKPRFTLSAGRCINRDGKPFVTIHGCANRQSGEGFDPTAWDSFARDVVAAMNKPGADGATADYYTITERDIGKYQIMMFGRPWPCDQWIGRIMQCDIGKRVFLRDGIVQVENDQQLQARIGHK
jgi:hypothetical protein